MPVPDSLLNDPAIAGPLGSLALSHVRPHSTSLALRALRWMEGLVRLGVVLPFALVHDVGLLFAAPREQLGLGPRVDLQKLAGRVRDGGRLMEVYGGVLGELGESEAARRAAQLKMNDDLIVVVLSRLLGTVAARTGTPPAYRAVVPVDATLFDDIDPQLPGLFAATRREFELGALAALESGRLFVLTMADALDLDTLRLFGMLGSEASAGALAPVDLLAALEVRRRRTTS